MGDVAGRLLFILVVCVFDVAFFGWLATTILLVPFRLLFRPGRSLGGIGPANTGGVEFFQHRGVQRVCVGLAAFVVFLVPVAGIDPFPLGFLIPVASALGTFLFVRTSLWTWRRMWE